MPILDDASPDEIARLLALFPSQQLKTAWAGVEGTKPELCAAVAASATRDQIVNFVESHLGVCKQHVYLFEHGGNVQLPEQLVGTERVKHTATSALYMAESITEVVQLDPHEDASIRFLWPIWADVDESHGVLRFVTLEKDIPSYFERPVLTRKHGIDEEEIVTDAMGQLSMESLDIHAGMKELWKAGFMDCYATKYKKAKSSATETVNRTEQKGIRENDPELFKVLLASEMRASVFVIEQADIGIAKISIDPGVGRISVWSYPLKVGAIADVVGKILQQN